MSARGAPGGARRPFVRAAARLAAVLCLAATPASAYAPLGAPGAMADLVGRLLPCVVSISSSRSGPRAEPGPSRSAASTPNFRRTSGSGFIIDASGLIVTNKHVVADAESLTVTLQDDSTYRASLVGQGITTDIALLKIEALRPLASVTFGDSDRMRPGDPVLAIGNPLSLGGSVSAGIVSAVNRDIGGDGPFADFIQTDAAINHGNSGGPLFNAAGEVIGMNTAIFTPNAASGSVGLGFAIPSRDVAFVVEQLRRYGRIHAGWVGLQLQRLTPGIIQAAHLTQPATGIVSDVDPGGPAAEAGVQPGDVVIRCTEHQASDPRSFLLVVAALEPGHRSGLVVWRDGRELTLPIVVEAWPAMRDAPTQVPPVPMRMDVEDFGLTLAKLGEAQRLRFQGGNFPDGVVVRDIDPASPAATTALGLGAVIREASHTVVHEPADVIQALARARDAGEQSALLLIEDDDGLRWITLPLRY